MRLRFEVIGEPVPQGSMVAIQSRNPGHENRPPFLKPGNEAKLKPWRQEIANAATIAATDEQKLPKTEPVAVTILFVMPKPKAGRYSYPVQGDVDKLVRAVLDGMTGVIYDDDTQVTNLAAVKRYALEGETVRALVTVETVSPDRSAGE